MLELTVIITGVIFLLLLVGLIVFTGIFLYGVLKLNEEVKVEHTKLMRERQKLLELKGDGWYVKRSSVLEVLSK